MTEILFSQLNYHPGQARVIEDSRNASSRFNVVCCGRRWGKSMLGIDLLTDTALDGQPAAWCSPTYKMLSEVWREALLTLHPVTRKVNVQERRIELITGGVIEFWSLEEPNSIRGRKYARIAVDEAAMVPGLQDAWQQVIRPTLTDFEGGAWFLSTPKGSNFFKTMFDWGRDRTGHPEWQSWQMPTLTNPFIKSSEVNAARTELPEMVYRQEYLAEFLQGEGSVFRRVRECAVLNRKEPYAGGHFVAGLDWGQQNDFTVIVVIDARTRQVVDMDRFNQIGWDIQRSRVRTMCDKWHVTRLVAEQNSIGGPNIEALQREGLPVEAFVTTASSKPPLIESLALAFEKDEIAVLSEPVMVAELEAYERSASAATGRPQYSAPSGSHDDTVIALALAWYAAVHGQPFHAAVGGQRQVLVQAQQGNRAAGPGLGTDATGQSLGNSGRHGQLGNRNTVIR